MNYSKLMVPEQLFILVTLGLSMVGFISVGCYIYWTIVEWKTLHSDKRIGTLFYIGLLLSVTVLFSLIPIKMLFR